MGLEDLLVWVSGSSLICYQLKKRFGWLAALSFGVTDFQPCVFAKFRSSEFRTTPSYDK